MPLSKCRYCGKGIPNIFHKWHELNQCIVARKARGEYVDPASVRRMRKREKEERDRQIEEMKQLPQKTLEMWV